MKGNLFLGMARGSVGDVTFSRVKGQQTARARNRQPNNPRTTKQMANRAKIATMVRFFSRSRQNLFSYAFESKKGNQSDYNAFVQNNSASTSTNSLLAVSQGWPMVGEFYMSEGSLTPLEITFGATNRKPSLNLVPLTTPVAAAAYTIGQLSQQIIDKYNLQNGDYITFVEVASQAQPATTLDEAIEYKALTNRVIGATWRIKQMQIDTNSTALVSSLGIFDLTGTGTQSFSTVIYGNITDAYTGSICYGTCVIASRVEVGKKVKTSTARLTVNAATKTAITIGQSTAWRTWVGENWQEQEEELLRSGDILKGSISENEVNFNMPVGVTLNGTTISNGQTASEFGTLVLNTYGHYKVTDIELYVDGVKWTPTSVSEFYHSYNVQSNGHFIFKVRDDVIFTFDVRSEQDFTIGYVATAGTGEENIRAEGRYWQVPIQASISVKGRGTSLIVTSNGKDISGLEPSITNGTITNVTREENKLTFGVVNNADVGEPNGIYVGNVLVVYIAETQAEPTATTTETATRTATRKASKA